jgi:hypothetical protein
VQGKYHDLKTAYMEDFKGREYTEPARPIRKQYLHKPRPFEGTTTNQDDFRYMGVPKRREIIRLKDNAIGNSGLKFEGTTTSQHDYRLWAAQPTRAAIKPSNEAKITHDDRDFTSEFQSQFVDMKGKTRRSRKPDAGANRENIKFEGTTTNQSDFQDWHSRPAVSAQPHTQYRARAEDRDFKTEVRMEFTEKKRDFCEALQVAVTSKPNNGHVLVERCGDRWCHVNHVHDWEKTIVQADGRMEGMPIF